MGTMETLLEIQPHESLFAETGKKLEMRSATMEITSTGMDASQIAQESNLVGSDQEGPLQLKTLALIDLLDFIRILLLIPQFVLLVVEMGLGSDQRSAMTIILPMEMAVNLIAQVSSQAGFVAEVAQQTKIPVHSALQATTKIRHPTQLHELLNEGTDLEWDQKNVMMTTHQTETVAIPIVQVLKVVGSVAEEVQLAKTHDHSDLLDIIRTLLLVPQFVLLSEEMDYELEQRSAMTITQRMEMAVSLIAQE